MPRGNIHILGVGNLGKLIAHSLRKYQPETRVTLLFHRQSLEQEWKDADQSIEIVRDGIKDVQNGFSHELLSANNQHIENLIVTTKTYTTVQALAPLKTRLNQQSTLLFVQNGIGTTDEVTSNIFPHSSSRPKYLAGIVSHGLYRNASFSSTHAGFADMVIGPVLVDTNEAHADAKESSSSSSSSSAAFLEQQLLGCPSLNAGLVSSKELLLAQMRKLVVNSVINPLTVIFDRRNGEIFQSEGIRALVRSLIREISLVLVSVIKARIGGNNHKEDLNRVSVTELETLVFEVGAKTARNISSMRQDALAGRRTEIDYMNGYIVRQAKELGISCPINTCIVELVKIKTLIPESEIQSTFGV